MKMSRSTDTCSAIAVSDVSLEKWFEEFGQKLQIISRVERGYGVVPIHEEGGVLLRQGEVAVYKEEKSFDLATGLYCMEHQRPVAMSPHADSRRDIEREVVFVRPAAQPQIDAAWEYLTLHSAVIRGIRRYARPEGPIYNWALADLLLGPVVGIYSPAPLAGEC